MTDMLKTVVVLFSIFITPKDCKYFNLANNNEKNYLRNCLDDLVVPITYKYASKI